MRKRYRGGYWDQSKKRVNTEGLQIPNQELYKYTDYGRERSFAFTYILRMNPKVKGNQLLINVINTKIQDTVANRSEQWFAGTATETEQFCGGLQNVKQGCRTNRSARSQAPSGQKGEEETTRPGNARLLICSKQYSCWISWSLVDPSATKINHVLLGKFSKTRWRKNKLVEKNNDTRREEEIDSTRIQLRSILSITWHVNCRNRK